MIRYILITIPLIMWACAGEEAAEATPEKKSPDTVQGTGKMDTVVNADGEFKVFFPNGTLHIEGQLDLEGNRTGVWRSYFENGKENSVNHYFKGELDGHTIVYHPNGQPYYIGEYLKGEKVGNWRFWDKAGNLTQDTTYSTEVETPTE